MNEALRLEYLSALEIDNYMPTLALVNAPGATLCELPDCQTLSAEQLSRGEQNSHSEQHSAQAGGLTANPTADLVTTSNANAEANTTTSHHQNLSDKTAGASALTALVDTSAQPKPQSATTLSPAKTPKSASENLEIPRFSLAFWRPHKDWLLVDSRNPEKLLPTDYLFQAIAFALGFKQANIREQEMMRWPMIKDDPESQSTEHARAMLQTYLEVQLDARPVKYLVLMGDAAQEYLTPNCPEQKVSETAQSNHWQAAHKNTANQNASSTDKTSDHEMLCTSSLSELLENPELKKPLWQALKQKLN